MVDLGESLGIDAAIGATPSQHHLVGNFGGLRLKPVAEVRSSTVWMGRMLWRDILTLLTLEPLWNIPCSCRVCGATSLSPTLPTMHRPACSRADMVLVHVRTATCAILLSKDDSEYDDSDNTESGNYCC